MGARLERWGGTWRGRGRRLCGKRGIRIMNRRGICSKAQTTFSGGNPIISSEQEWVANPPKVKPRQTQEIQPANEASKFER
jgi:hypothetical protein